MKKESEHKVISVNKKAVHDFFIIETIEAGIALLGTEVKSIREGRINLKDSYAKVTHNEVFLYNSHISPCSCSSHYNHDPLRKRKLLLKKREIRKFIGKAVEKGNTLVPLRVYFKGRLIKLELALATGKKLYDKRDDIKRKEEERQMSRALKSKFR